MTNKQKPPNRGHIPILLKLLGQLPYDASVDLPIIGAVLKLNARNEHARNLVQSRVKEIQTLIEIGPAERNRLYWRICLDIVRRTGIANPKIRKHLRETAATGDMEARQLATETLNAIEDR